MSDEQQGPGTWATAAWRVEATGWADEALAPLGRHVHGVEQPHLRPWATALRLRLDDDSVVWLKAAAPRTSFEVGAYEVLATVVPDHVLEPLALDAERGWMLLPDGGLSLGERLEGPELLDALVQALVSYGEVQRALEPHVDELLAAGVHDMRPAVMPERFDEAVEAVRSVAVEERDVTGQVVADRVAGMRAQVVAWCDQLADSGLPASLDHNDLHPWNVLGGARTGEPARFYDWGDAVVAHPFAAALVPLGMVHDPLGGGDEGVARARSAYLGGFEAPPGEDLGETLEVACRVAKVARTLTWVRVTEAARPAGEPLEEQFARAPRESLRALLDDTYLGRT
jgi:hypothetical protein